jgi:hypothetical protein
MDMAEREACVKSLKPELTQGNAEFEKLKSANELAAYFAAELNLIHAVSPGIL